ncbi:MAG: gamma-glutamyl-gamma-aminobutyrate hydrolase family protein [Bacteroidota bacterium]
MKKTAFGFILILLSISLSAQQYFGTPEAAGHRCIVLMNPTENNLKTVIYLIDNKIFPIPDDYNLVGFYHSSQVYDFSLSAKFIKESGRKNIFLHACVDSTGEEVFAKNVFSDDFNLVFAGSMGVIFFGGPDIPPSLYHQETSLLTEITDYDRHIFEASFLFHLLGGYQNENYVPLLEQKPDYRILGICLGMQTMNVATGGTLIQDIPSRVYRFETAEQVLAAEPDTRHRNYNTNMGTDNELIYGHFHRIKVVLPERMQALMPGSENNPYVLSSHHQAAGRIGKGLRVSATSMDGKIVEALVHEKYQNVIAFQFHPEPTFLYQAETKFRSMPGKPSSGSFIELYSGINGETFNRNIWKWMGGLYK